MVLGEILGGITGQILILIIGIFLILYISGKYKKKSLSKTTKIFGQSTKIILFFFGIVCLIVAVMIILAEPQWTVLQIMVFIIIIIMALVSFWASNHINSLINHK